jgi:hypothetical protein
MRRILLLSAIFLLHFTPGVAQRSVVASGPTTNDRFPKKVGNLRFSDTILKLGKVHTNELRSDTLRVLNASGQNIRWNLPKELPAHLSMGLSSEELAPGAEGWIAFRYDAREKNDYGVVFDRVVLVTNDPEVPQKVVTVSANLTEYFAPLSGEDSVMVQRSRIPETVFDFGAVRQGEKVQHAFPVYNDGKRDLFLHRIRSACGCIKTAIIRQVIPPGDSTVIQLTYDSFGKEGREVRNFLLFQNDPAAPDVKFEIRGTVNK